MTDPDRLAEPIEVLIARAERDAERQWEQERMAPCVQAGRRIFYGLDSGYPECGVCGWWHP